ncbi:MAG TPA: hypothetical protein VGC62_27395, partial [Pseudomonas sp.]|uniref:hypothetical protein n=1 Tax=Pseudomonas sp. TaxID=306 RepID=UPI002ED94D4C
MKFLLSAAFLILIFGCTPVKNSSYRAGPEEAFVNLKPYAVGGSFTVYGSPEKLIKKINELGGAQGDLETNSAFSERMSKLGNSAVISKVDNYQIKFDKDTGKISYEARIEDAQEWGFRAKGQSMIEYDKRYLSLSLPETTYSKGEYVGQNSFGVKAVVGVVDIDRVYLVSPAITKESRGVLFVKLIADLDISLS